jgi:predicted TIM-barrel fold metal-dependent hydrolase
MSNIFGSKLSRRAALRHAAGAVAVGATAGWHGWPANRLWADEAKFPAGKYVDVHTHIGQVWDHSPELDVPGLLKWMDSFEVAQAVVLPLVSPESSSYLILSDFVLQQTKDHRDRLIPFCCIDPRTSVSGGKQGLVDMLKRYKDAGAKGFGEHKSGVRMDSRPNMTLFAACNEVQLPVLFHLDGMRNMDDPGLPGLSKVLGEFPDLAFIGHGPGWWASISGDVTQLHDYPKGPVAPNGAIDVLMDKHPNLWGDLSAGSGSGALERDMKFAREFVIRRADRLMFGSDYLSPGQAVPQFQVLTALDLPEDVQAKVFRDNARKLILGA